MTNTEEQEARADLYRKYEWEKPWSLGESLTAREVEMEITNDTQ